MLLLVAFSCFSLATGDGGNGGELTLVFCSNNFISFKFSSLFSFIFSFKPQLTGLLADGAGRSFSLIINLYNFIALLSPRLMRDSLVRLASLALSFM